MRGLDQREDGAFQLVHVSFGHDGPVALHNQPRGQGGDIGLGRLPGPVRACAPRRRSR
jgi:hypothetical protein